MTELPPVLPSGLLGGMAPRGSFRRRLGWPLVVGGFAAACGGKTTAPSGGTAALTGGTANASGGTSSGGEPSGGTSTGGSNSGGAHDVGGAPGACEPGAPCSFGQTCVGNGSACVCSQANLYSCTGLPGGAPSAGGSNTGGAASGGPASGGVSTGGVSTGGTATGGTFTSGASSGGAATGGTGTGGSATGGSAPAVCATVPSLPTMGMACATSGESQCDARGNQCVCVRRRGVLPVVGTWYCNNLCPGSQPTPNTACTRGQACIYNNGNTGCVCVNLAWICVGVPDCPTSQPSTGTACSANNIACDYPNTNPALHMACMCTFDADAGSLTWNCFESAECPATQPAYSLSATCTGPAICTYTTSPNHCACPPDANSSWVCGLEYIWPAFWVTPEYGGGTGGAGGRAGAAGTSGGA